MNPRNRHRPTRPPPTDSDAASFFPTFSDRQRHSNEPPVAHPLSFRERIMDQQQRILFGDDGVHESDIGESWVDEAPSQQLQSEWLARQEPSIQRTPFFDNFQDGLYGYDLEENQWRSPSYSGPIPNSLSHPGGRYNRQCRQRRMPATPPSPDSYMNPSAPPSPYLNNNEPTIRPPSPAPPSIQAPYTCFKPGQKTTFFSLPLELRQEIYNNIFGFEEPVGIKDISEYTTKPWHKRPKSALLCICKQIYEEASNFLYSNTDFVIDISEREDGFKIFSPETRKRIRKLQLHIFPLNGYPLPVWFEPELWEPVLANVTSLSIVVQEPFNLEDREKELSWKEMEQWRRWAGPIFEYIDEHLAVDVVVGIDDNNQNITSKLVEKRFKKHTMKREETRAGDWVFTRGKVKEFYDDDKNCSVM